MTRHISLLTRVARKAQERLDEHEQGADGSDRASHRRLELQHRATLTRGHVVAARARRLLQAQRERSR